MALTPNTNEAFLREVDEELRRDQAAQLWRRWGLWGIGAVLVLLAAFGAYLFWQSRQHAAAGRQGETLQGAYDSLAAQKAAAATAPLATLATSDNGGYRALAIFTQGDVLLQKDDLAGAATKFGAIAQDASIAQPFRDLALIRQTNAQFDTLKPEVVIARLRGMAVPGNAWFGSAGELVAVAHMKQGRRDLAGQMFARIARDEATPESLRQRAVQMAGVLGVDAVDTAGNRAKR